MESARFLFYTRIFPPFQEILHILILKSNAALYPPTPPDNGCPKYRLAATPNIPQNTYMSITVSHKMRRITCIIPFYKIYRV